MRVVIHARTWVLGLAVCGGCGAQNPGSAGGGGGQGSGAGSTSDAGSDRTDAGAHVGSGGDAAMRDCTLAGGACSRNADCCGNFCGATGRCDDSMANTCSSVGEDCVSDFDCCSFVCGAVGACE